MGDCGGRAAGCGSGRDGELELVDVDVKECGKKRRCGSLTTMCLGVGDNVGSSDATIVGGTEGQEQQKEIVDSEGKNKGMPTLEEGSRVEYRP
jgi:hypothetical protein